MKPTIAIIGGGITGLTVAYRLIANQKKHDFDYNIILLESKNRLGGVIKSDALDGFVIEHGPDAFLADRPEIKNLIRELNLESELISTNKINRRAFIAQKNKLLTLPKGFFMIAPTDWLSFLASPLFTFTGKLRIAFEMFIPNKKNTDKDESVEHFLLRRFGNELFKKAGQPLVSSIHMGDVSLLSAKSAMPYFVSLEQEYGSILKGLLKTKHHKANTASGARYNLFSSFKNGTETLVKQLTNQLTGVQINLNTTVQSLKIGQSKRWQLLTADDRSIEADFVVFTTPASLAGKIINNMDKGLAAVLSFLENSASVVVNLLYKQEDIHNNIDGFGFVLPASEKKNIIACGLISKKFINRSKSGYEIMRVFIGGQQAPELCDLTDTELKQIAHAEITTYLKIKHLPQAVWLTRWHEGLPFYKIGQAQAVKTINDLAKRHDGLFFAGASYNGLGIPDCVRSGETTANLIIESLVHKEAYASAG